LLKEIQRSKQKIEGELERTKLEIKEINLRHKDTELNPGSEAATKKAAAGQLRMSDPAGTKFHFKLSEIVMRPKKQRGSHSSSNDFKEDGMRIFYSVSDGADQFFNSVQESQYVPP
jgi:hypothetical protein